MNILFLAHLWNPNNITDDQHLQQALEKLGHEVVALDTNYWRKVVEDPIDVSKWTPNSTPSMQAAGYRMQELVFDLILTCKGASAELINRLRERFQCPVIYWCWDRMLVDWPPPGKKHRDATVAADMYFGPCLGRLQQYRKMGANFHYLPLDVAPYGYSPSCRKNARIDKMAKDGLFPVVFTGTCHCKGTRRIDTFLEIERLLGDVEFHAFGDGYWEREGFTRHHPPIWEDAFQCLVEQSKICLAAGGLTPIEGCWSNRAARYLVCGGFVLTRYVPGMERTFGPDGENLVYWQEAADCVERIEYYLAHDDERAAIAARGQRFAQKYLTFDYRARQMMTILHMEKMIDKK